MSWNAFGTKSGVQISDLVESSFDYKLPTTNARDREICLKYVVDSIDDYCNDHRRRTQKRRRLSKVQQTFASMWCLTGVYLGNYLVVLYATTKLMYISISFIQIFILSVLLGSNFAMYGVRVIERLFRGLIFFLIL